MHETFVRAIVAVIVVAVSATPAAAGTEAEPSLVVSVAEDGDAEVTLTLTYDLTSENERDAFKTLENDSDAQKQVRDRFRDRMASVADRAENTTGRAMSVDNATVKVYVSEDGKTGVVRLQVTWHGLAAVDGDRIVVTEPFASGFTADRKVTLIAPDGYERTGASPEPGTTSDGQLTWKQGTSLDGFEVVFSSASEEATTSQSTEEQAGQRETDKQASSAISEVPGFGIAIAMVSLTAAGLLALRQQ
ncbi:DUF7345 domain-containing protein [Halorussus sp. AFM4]|uniref:DUF7345 domain-containing protein n=1 Tax=Halorussus sp. AFM4 TaxID=3421651 RepID=UPI003EB8FF23